MYLLARIASYCILASLFFASQDAAAGNVSIISSDRWVTVTEVFDGDTFKTRKGEIVRLLGIDCPELAKHNAPGEPLATVASDALQNLVEGQLVRLKTDKEKRDRYDRLLAQVYLRDGTWVNGELVTQGLAYVYTFPPNLRWADDLLKLEQAARNAELGIWREQRFRVLDADMVEMKYVGQFRVVEGIVIDIKRNDLMFRVGELEVNVPRKYRPYFQAPPLVEPNTRLLVRGTLRQYKGRLRLGLHSPADMEILSP